MIWHYYSHNLIFDKIDEEDKLRDRQRNVIKFWNVIYNNPEDDVVDEQEEEPAAAMTVSDEPDESDYNAATGSYSGGYGKGGVDEENRDHVDSILAQHDLDISGLFNDYDLGADQSGDEEAFDEAPDSGMSDASLTPEEMEALLGPGDGEYPDEMAMESEMPPEEMMAME